VPRGPRVVALAESCAGAADVGEERRETQRADTLGEEGVLVAYAIEGAEESDGGTGRGKLEIGNRSAGILKSQATSADAGTRFGNFQFFNARCPMPDFKISDTYFPPTHVTAFVSKVR
jgi:hypothetical protein